jgi:putative inorganic carbon (HCO3(-)) transporter
LAILLLMIWTSWQVYRTGKERQSGWITSLGAGLLLSQLALITHGMTDAVTWGMVRSAPLVWSIWGIVAAARLLILPLKAKPNHRSNNAKDV